MGLLFLLPGGLVWAQDAGTIEYPENGTDAVATFTAVDPEADHITWSLSGEDADVFTIVGGVLRFSSSPDYEARASTSGNNTYVVTVDASDGTNSDTEDVEIEVTNVDEAGTVMLSTLQPQVEVALMATLTDSDDVVERHCHLDVVQGQRHYRRRDWRYVYAHGWRRWLHSEGEGDLQGRRGHRE